MVGEWNCLSLGLAPQKGSDSERNLLRCAKLRFLFYRIRESRCHLPPLSPD